MLKTSNGVIRTIQNTSSRMNSHRTTRGTLLRQEMAQMGLCPSSCHAEKLKGGVRRERPQRTQTRKAGARQANQREARELLQASRLPIQSLSRVSQKKS